MHKKALSLFLIVTMLLPYVSVSAQKTKAIGKLVKGAIGVAAGYEIGKKVNQNKSSNSSSNTPTTITYNCPSCQGNKMVPAQTIYGVTWQTCSTCGGVGTVTRISTPSKTRQKGSSISFTGYGACEYYNSLTKERCKCTGYKGDGAKGPCRECGHGYTQHYR